MRVLGFGGGVGGGRGGVGVVLGCWGGDWRWGACFVLPRLLRPEAEADF